MLPLKFIILIFILHCTIGVKGQSDVYISGNLSLTTNINSINGIDRRKPAQAFALTGNPTLHIGQFSIPFGVIFSNYQRDFRQPFNQLGASPKYKGLQFHLGHRSLNWSNYSLGGHRFFGAGFETQLDVFRLGYIRGRFLNAIAIDTSIQSLTYRPSYTRNGFAAKVGIGTDQSFLDIIYFKSEDQFSLSDSIRASENLKPTKNVVVGIRGQLTLASNFTMNADIGISGLTRDVRAMEFETDSTGLANLATRFLEPKLSTQANTAGEISIAYKSRTFGADVKYKRIDPGFISHGTYYLRTDLIQKSIGSFLTLGSGKMRLAGRLGKEHDNIKNQKDNTTNRTIFSAQLNTQLSRAIRFNAQYANFGISQEGQQVTISDTTRLNNLTKSIILNPNINIQSGQLNHNLNLVYSNQVLDDQNRFTAQFTSIKAKAINANYSLGLGKSGFTSNVGWNRITAELPVGITVSKGLIFGIGKRFVKQKLSLNASYNRNSNLFENNSNGSTSRLNLNLQWKAGKNHQIQLHMYRLSNNSLNSLVSRTFSETNIRTTYTFRFSTKKQS